MTIQSSAKLFKEKCLIHRTDLSELRGTRLAIDGHSWIKNLQFNEPLHMAMGGIPLSLAAVVDEEIDKLKKYDIKPLFIFNGVNLFNALNYERKTSAYNWVQNVGLDQYRRREEGWRAHLSDDYTASQKEFRAAGSATSTSDFIEALLKYFRSKNIEFFRAPYLAWAQAAWFCGQRDKICSAVWGSEEILMFIGLCQHDRLITRIDFEKGSFEWVCLKEICNALGGTTSITTSQFIDCCLLVGFRGSFMRGMIYNPDEHVGAANEIGEILEPPSGPHSVQNQSFASSFRDIQAVAKDILQHRTGPNLLEVKVRYSMEGHYSMPRPAEQYLDILLEQFLRLKNLVIHHIIINTDCKALPISVHNSTHADLERNYYGNSQTTGRNIINNIVPNNLFEIIGPRLPNLVYFFLSIGLVSPQVINNVVHNTMIECIPNIDTYEYRELLQKIVPLRTQIAYLLINCVMRNDNFWKVIPHGGKREIMIYIQWHTDKTIALHTPPELLLDDWDVSWKRDLLPKLPKDESGNVVMNFCSVLQFARYALKSVSIPTVPPKTYTNFGEILCVILLKSLDLLGYFTHPPHQKPIGNEESGTSLFADALSEVSCKYAEQGLLFIELLRTSALSCAPLTPGSPTVNGNDYIPISPNDPKMLLISRVVSIIPMTLSAGEWGSELVSRDLCAFHVLFKSLYKTLRNLCEIILMVMFLDNRIKLSIPDTNILQLFNDLVQRLPFYDNIDTAMGIVMYYVLLHQSPHITNPDEKWASLQLEKKFPRCVNLKGDLSKAYGFWHEAMKVVSRLEKGGAIPSALYRQFEEANAFLCSSMSSYGIELPVRE